MIARITERDRYIMSPTFPMFFLEGPVLSLDDESTFHRLLTKLLPKDWDLRCHTNQAEFIAEINRQVELEHQACATLAKLISEWRTGELDLITALVAFWRSTTDRPANLALVDYRMPLSTGSEMLAREPMRSWHGCKLMLTAHADERIAVDAFSRGLISQFMSKSQLADDPTIAKQTIASLRRVGNQHIERTWSAQVLPEQITAIESIHGFLEGTVKEREWVDFAVLGQPFGLLARTAGNSIEWLQLETSATLPALIELLENTGWATSDCDEVRAGKSLIAAEILNTKTPKQPALRIENDHTEMWAAVFELDLAT